MFNRYSKYRLPAWLRGFRDGVEAVVLPLLCFQLLRTIFFPTTFDVILLTCLGLLYLSFLKRWI